MHHEVEAGGREGTVVHAGAVIAVCYSEELINGVGKEPRESGHVTRLGIPGDRHYGETRWSSSARRHVPNNRPITVVGAEALRDACERLGIPPVPAGGIGENLLTEGMGDLSDVLPDDEIHVFSGDETEPSVVLHVRKQNEPCSNLSIYHRLMVKELFGKRGLLCTVLKEGNVRPGDRVEVVRRADTKSSR